MSDGAFENFCCWYRLAKIKGLTTISRSQLWQSLSDLEVFQLADFRQALKEITGQQNLLQQFDQITVPEDLLPRLKKNKIAAIAYNSRQYPKRLREIASPPAVLYRRGRHPAEEIPRIAVVGSRKVTAYGRAAAFKIISGLVNWGVSIVSGLARGVDGISHQLALQKDSETIAVMASGLDIVYPPEHQKIYRQICQKFTSYSEFEPGEAPKRAYFPQRNRLMSGLSDGVVVIEAGQKSGSLITARFAIEQNRDLYALPGNIDSKQSAGSNFLLSQGAKAISSASDVINDLKIRYHHYFAQQLTKQKENTDKNNIDKLSQEENTVLLFIAQAKDGKNIEQLQNNFADSNIKLAEILIKLEIKGLIGQGHEGTFNSLIEIAEEG